VTTIKESQNLHILYITILFEKIEEYEHEIIRLDASEEGAKNKDESFFALNASYS